MSEDIRELVIIGSGPAGLTAGIYSGRAALKPLILAGNKYGGQLMLTTEVENFPGFPEGIQGPELIQNMFKQAERFGAEIMYKDVTKVKFDNNTDSNHRPVHKIYIGDEEISAYSVIIATGAVPRQLDIPGETEFWGKGVSSCATCDGAFYREKTIAVVGGGDSAMEEATFLTRFAKKVYIIHRRKELRASIIMQKRAFDNEKIEFIYDTVISEVKGGLTVEGLVLENTQTREKSEIELDGLFLAIGYIPETELFGNYLNIDKNGYAQPEERGRTKTKVPGVFIAGDVEDDFYRQAITAAADGCKAALEAEKWLAGFE